MTDKSQSESRRISVRMAEKELADEIAKIPTLTAA
jgi:hypothetical protein